MDHPTPARAQLDATRRAIDRDFATLALRWRKLLRAAEQHAKDATPSDVAWGRATTKWRLIDELVFQARLRRLVTDESASLLTLLARINRRLAAEADQVRRLRPNEPWRTEATNRAATIELMRLLADGQGPVRLLGTNAQQAAADPPKPA